MDRFEKLGRQMMNRTQMGGADAVRPHRLGPRRPRQARTAAQLLGQAYVTAYNLVRHNREAVASVADTLIERRELHGDEVTDLLDSVDLHTPEIDLLDPEAWPKP